MIEAFAQEVSSERFCEAVRFGFQKVCHEKRYKSYLIVEMILVKLLLHLTEGYISSTVSNHY